MKRTSELGVRFASNHHHLGRHRSNGGMDAGQNYWACESMCREAQRILRNHEQNHLYMNENETDYAAVGEQEGRPFKKVTGEEAERAHFSIFTKEDVEKYLAISEEWDVIPLDHHLFCVLNTRDYLPWHSAVTLAFYDDGLVLRTSEPTNSVMERIFNKVGISYEVMRSLCRLMDGKRPTCSPYTYGNTCYLPVNGPSKNAVTWISLTHVTNYKRVKGQRNKIQLEFLNRHRLELQMRPDTFEGHLTVAAQSLATQHYHLKVRLHHNGMEAVQREHRFSNSVLQQWLHHNNWKVSFSFRDIGRLLFMSEFEHIRRHPQFKDNPFTEEIWNHLHERLLAEE